MRETNLANARSRREFLAAAAAAPLIVPASVFGQGAPASRINIGIIGAGRIAREHDIPAILRHGSARIIAVSDLDSKRLALGRQFVESQYEKRSIGVTVRAYADYRDLLRDKEVDAVIICTPDHWHAKPTIDAVRAGKDVYLEKPFSLTIAEGRAMSDAVRSTGRIFQVGTQQRSSEHFRIACELVRNGRVGRLQTVEVGLPTDPGGEEEPEMPVPQNLAYDAWLGSTPPVYYTEKRVHPQNDFSRPGWLRCEQFGAGMITGWGAHHIDIAHWGMGTELAGPVELEAAATFPKKGVWDVHGQFSVMAKYADGITLYVSDEFPNGVRFVGSEGWLFVTRGSTAVTSSDPIAAAVTAKGLSASHPRILSPLTDSDKVRLYKSADHHGNWLECIRSREQTICPAEVGHRSTSACLLSHMAMRLKRRLHWDPETERFKNDDEANSHLARPQRAPYKI